MAEPLHNAKGIVVVPIEGPTEAVSRSVYDHHVAALPDGDVVPCLIGSELPAVVPGAFSAERVDVSAVGAAPGRRFLLIIDDAGTLSAPEFKRIFDVLKSAFKSEMNFRVRIMFVCNIHGHWAFQPFYESTAFADRRFKSRVMRAIVPSPIVHSGGNASAVAELVSRVSAGPYGADASDPWVAAQIRAQNTSRPTPADFRDGAEPYSLVASTRSGLAASVYARWLHAANDATATA